MKAITDAEKQLYGQSNIRNITLEFSNKVTITNENIASESMTFEEMICENDSLVFGSCNSSSFTIEVRDTAHTFKGCTLKASITCGSYTRKIGTFIVDSDNKTDDKTRRQIKAYDVLHSAMNTDVASWYNSLTFPTTLKAFRDSFFKYLGITQVDVLLINDSMSIEKTIQATTLKAQTIMENICEINACFGHINSDGLFEYISLKNRLDTLYPDNGLYPSETTIFGLNVTPIDIKLSSLKYEDFTCKPITEVKIRQEENDVGCTVGKSGNTYVIQGNYLLYGKGTDELTKIANNFLECAFYVEYTPSSAVMQGKPWIELGDYVSIQALNGDNITVPVLHRTLSGIIALTDSIEAKGKQVNVEKQTITNQIQQAQGKSNILEKTIEKTRSEIKEYKTSTDGKFSQVQTSIEQTAEHIKSDAQKIYETKESATSSYGDLNTKAQSYASTAESNAKSHADSVGESVDGKAKGYAKDAEKNANNHADDVASDAEKNAKDYADDRLKLYTGTTDASTFLQTFNNIKSSVQENTDTINEWISIYPENTIYPADDLIPKNGTASSSEVTSYVDIKVGEVTQGVESSTQSYVDKRLVNYSTNEEVKSLVEITKDGFKQSLDSTTTECKTYTDSVGSTIDSNAKGYADTAESNAKNHTNTALNNYSTTTQVKALINSAKDGITLDYQKAIDHLGTLHPANDLYPGTKIDDNTDYSVYPQDGYATTSATESMIQLSEKGIEQKVTSQIEKNNKEIENSYSNFVQEAKLMRMLVTSGANESDIILTDRFINLVSENINLGGKVTFSTFDDALKNKLAEQSVENIYSNGTTTIDGGKIMASSITADKLTIGVDSNIVTINSDTAESLKVPLCTLSKNTLVENSIITKAADKYLTLCNYRPWDLSYGDEIYFKGTLCGTGETAHVEVVLFNASKQKISSFKSDDFMLPVDSYETFQTSISIGHITQTASYYVVAIVRNTTGNSFEIMDGAVCKTKADGELIVNGSITAEQLATDAIKSRNYVQGSIGSFMNMADGSYDSKNLKWDKYGQLTANSATITDASIVNATIKGGSLDIETDDKSYDQILLRWLNSDKTVEALTKINPGTIQVFSNGDMSASTEINGEKILIGEVNSGTTYSSDGVSISNGEIISSITNEGIYTRETISADSDITTQGNMSAKDSIYAQNIVSANELVGNRLAIDGNYGVNGSIYIVDYYGNNIQLTFKDGVFMGSKTV